MKSSAERLMRSNAMIIIIEMGISSEIDLRNRMGNRFELDMAARIFSTHRARKVGGGCHAFVGRYSAGLF